MHLASILSFIFLLLLVDSAKARTSGMDLRHKRIELSVGAGFGQSHQHDNTYNVDYKTTPIIYSAGFYGGKPQRLWGVTLAQRSFTLEEQLVQTLTALGTYSFKVGKASAKQDFFFGLSLRSFTYSRDISLDGIHLNSTNVTQLSPGVVLTYQRNFQPFLLYFTKVMVDVPIYATEKYSADLQSQIGASLNNGLLFEVSKRMGVGTELQFRLDRSSTGDETDKKFLNLAETSILVHFIYLF